MTITLECNRLLALNNDQVVTFRYVNLQFVLYSYKIVPQVDTEKMRDLYIKWLYKGYQKG